jgi:hypothetical protein
MTQCSSNCECAMGNCQMKNGGNSGGNDWNPWGGNSGGNSWCKSIGSQTGCNYTPQCKWTGWGSRCQPKDEDEIDSADFDFDQSSPDEEDYDSEDLDYWYDEDDDEDVDEAVAFTEA